MAPLAPPAQSKFLPLLNLSRSNMDKIILQLNSFLDNSDISKTPYFLDNTEYFDFIYNCTKTSLNNRINRNDKNFDIEISDLRILEFQLTYFIQDKASRFKQDYYRAFNELEKNPEKYSFSKDRKDCIKLISKQFAITPNYFGLYSLLFYN